MSYIIETREGRLIGGWDTYDGAERWGRDTLGSRALWGWSVRHLLSPAEIELHANHFAHVGRI